MENTAESIRPPRTVSGIMTQNLFTVHPDNEIDRANSIMDWKQCNTY